MARWVDHSPLDSPRVMISWLHEFEPCGGLCAASPDPAWDSVSPSLCLVPDPGSPSQNKQINLKKQNFPLNSHPGKLTILHLPSAYGLIMCSLRERTITFCKKWMIVGYFNAKMVIFFFFFVISGKAINKPEGQNTRLKDCGATGNCFQGPHWFF